MQEKDMHVNQFLDKLLDNFSQYQNFWIFVYRLIIKIIGSKSTSTRQDFAMVYDSNPLITTY